MDLNGAGPGEVERRTRDPLDVEADLGQLLVALRVQHELVGEAEASDGPTSLAVPPYSLAPAMPALSTIVSYGLLTCFGRNATLRPFLIGAFGFAFAPLVAVLEELKGGSGNRVAFVSATDGSQMEIIEKA